MKVARVVAAAMLLGGSGMALHATLAQQPPGIVRTPVVRHHLDVPGREVIQVRVDFAPGAAFGAHSHPGVEIAHVLEGSLEYRLQGQTPVTLEAGESLFIPAGVIHEARNSGTVDAAELATYLVETGKPLVTLVE